MNFNVEAVVFIAFLLLNLGIGLYYGRGVKTIQDYALGNRNFSTGALVSTIIATWVGGDYLFITMAEVYTTGLHYAIGCLGMVTCLLLNAYLFAPRMREFLGSVSVASAMGDLYGPQVRIISAISGTIASAGFIAVQFKVFGYVLENFLSIPGNYPVYLAAIIVIIYSAFGGIRSVTFTDIIQLFTFGVLIPVLSIVVWNDCSAQPDFNLMAAIQHPLFDYREFLDPSKSKFWSLLLLFIMFSLPDLNPTMFQRVAIGRSIEQVQKAFSIASILLMLILIGMAWISFLLFNVNPNLQPSGLVQYLIDNYSSTGLRIFILLGIVSMCMSTADSNINSSSVLITHDFCTPLNIKFKSEIILSRIISVLLGIISIYLALLDYDLLPLVFMTQSFYIPIVDIPLLMAILGFRSSSKSVLIGMGAAFISVIIWRSFYMDTGVDSILPASLVNFIFFMGSHYLLKQKGGWTKNKTDANSIRAKSTSYKLKNIINIIKGFDILAFCKKNSPKNELIYLGFGIFCTISTICTMYTISNVLGTESKGDLIFIYEIMLIVSVIFISHVMWPNSFKDNIIVKLSWTISTFGLLIFCSSFFLMMSKFNDQQFVVFLVNIIVAAVLIRWNFILMMVPIGFYLATLFYKRYTGLSSIDINMTSASLVFYSFLLIGTAIVIFLKPKQEEEEQAVETIDHLEGEVVVLGHKVNHMGQEVSSLNEKVTHYSQRITDQAMEIERLGATAQKILNNVNHELRLPVGNVMNFAEMLSGGLGKYTKKQLKELSDEVFKNSNRLSTMILNMLDLAMLDVKKIELNKKTINLSELIEDRVDQCRKIYLQGKNIKFDLNLEPVIMVSVDPNYIRQTIDNLVINAINYSKDGTIKVSALVQDKNMVVITIQDEGIGIPRSELFDIFTPFKMGTNTESKAEGRGVGLALCKAAIEAHGGEIKVDSKGKGAIFKVVLSLS